MKPLYLCTFCLGMVSFTATAQDFDRGIELYRKNDFAAAASTLRQVVDADGSNARANRYLGLALLEQGKAAEAAQWKQALAAFQQTTAQRQAMPAADGDGQPDK